MASTTFTTTTITLTHPRTPITMLYLTPLPCPSTKISSQTTPLPEASLPICPQKRDSPLSPLPRSLSSSSSKVQVIPNCSILAAVGQKIACTPRVSATLFNALAKANINVCAIAHGCTEYKITVVIKQEDCFRAPRAVHFRLYLSRTAIAVGNIRPALIGVTLFDQLRDQRKLLLSTVRSCSFLQSN
ncbi:bifunctional aspartokinase/homoserine dehydrogenase 1, chloroplastic-like isoform X2 [Pyrus x bretschneideri]|uniref:bifunctional aspartokinase/homoserine dehydrogenase 1, chloroplastic-like isoform X2 n=1 Tax=Pyrus x bretschneideri TaxID=225117 RepID=UPI00202DD0A5|nr:bifunctional aspartokinase/homoserine dehydrogenase 1, chloroplastic-like isoform X2 [Pyrus x bretschneideri]